MNMAANNCPTIEPNPRDANVSALEWRMYGTNDSVFECRVLIYPESEGGFSAYALRLPGVVSQGETFEETVENITDACQAVISEYIDSGLDIPWEDVEMERPAGWKERWIIVNA